MESEDAKVANIIAAELNPEGCYFIAFDEPYWSFAQMKGIAEALQTRFPDMRFVAAMGSFHDGDCGIKFLDPSKLEEVQ